MDTLKTRARHNSCVKLLHDSASKFGTSCAGICTDFQHFCRTLGGASLSCIFHAAITVCEGLAHATQSHSLLVIDRSNAIDLRAIDLRKMVNAVHFL